MIHAAVYTVSRGDPPRGPFSCRFSSLQAFFSLYSYTRQKKSVLKIVFS